VIQDFDHVANDIKLAQMILNWLQEFLRGIFNGIKKCFESFFLVANVDIQGSHHINPEKDAAFFLPELGKFVGHTLGKVICKLCPERMSQMEICDIMTANGSGK
jgi:hypothetical protein